MAGTLQLPQILYQPFAQTGDRNTILNTPSVDEPQLANLQTGFPPITQKPVEDENGIPPERKDFNGLGYLLSSFYFFTQCGGTYTFNQDVSDAIGGYPVGARLYYTASDGNVSIVESVLENNTYNFVTNPEYIDGVKWKTIWSRFSIKTISQTSGNISFDKLGVYRMTINGNTVISLPTPIAGIENQIKVYLSIGTTSTVDWGTTKYYDGHEPFVTAGNYVIYYDYDFNLSSWVVGQLTIEE